MKFFTRKKDLISCKIKIFDKSLSLYIVYIEKEYLVKGIFGKTKIIKENFPIRYFYISSFNIIQTNLVPPKFSISSINGSFIDYDYNCLHLSVAAGSSGLRNFCKEYIRDYPQSEYELIELYQNKQKEKKRREQELRQGFEKILSNSKGNLSLIEK